MEPSHPQMLQLHISWMDPIHVMLGSLEHGQIQACSISSVTDELREPNEAAFKPKLVSIGPLHRGSSRHVQLMEETKWRYMREFLDRQGTQEQNRRSEERLTVCGIDILNMDTIIMASYGGNIKLEAHELAKIMLVDGCFLLEFFLRLSDINNIGITNVGWSYSNDPILQNHKKIMSVLNDITMLENQIPFIVLKKLYRKVFPVQGLNIDNDHRVANIVRQAFGYSELDNSGGVHILHLMHLSTVEQTHQEGESTKRLLLRCATKLHAAGIEIRPVDVNMVTQHNLVDWFNFDISFEGNVLSIPPLYVKETTEVRWRNLIAWEQSRIFIRCKYTSYALFFQGLICCKHDIQLLERKGIIVNKTKKNKDDLLKLFCTIYKGADYMDSSYKQISESLNTYRRSKIRSASKEFPIVTWHKCRRTCEIIVYYWRNWYNILIRDHIPTVWKLIAVLAACTLLVLSIMQTYYSSRQNNPPEQQR